MVCYVFLFWKVFLRNFVSVRFPPFSPNLHFEEVLEATIGGCVLSTNASANDCWVFSLDLDK